MSSVCPALISSISSIPTGGFGVGAGVGGACKNCSVAHPDDEAARCCVADLSSVCADLFDKGCSVAGTCDMGQHIP